MKYKAVFFDMDGTILDTLKDLHAAVQYALNKMGLPGCTIEQCRGWLGSGARNLMRQALPADAGNEKLERALLCFREYYSENCRNETKPYEGIRELLLKLRQNGVGITVISNKIADYVAELSAEYFPGLVDMSMGDSPGVRLKPWPDLLLKAAQEQGFDIDECLYVGDSEMDVQAAKNAGMDCVSVTWGFRTRQQLEKVGALRIAENCGELEKLIMG